MSKRPSEEIMKIYDWMKSTDKAPAGSIRNLELKVRALGHYLDKVWEKTPHIFPLILLAFLQFGFSEAKLENRNGQILLGYAKTQDVQRVVFPNYCYKKVIESGTLSDGSLYIDFERDNEGCERLRKELVVNHE